MFHPAVAVLLTAGVVGTSLAEEFPPTARGLASLVGRSVALPTTVRRRDRRHLSKHAEVSGRIVGYPEMGPGLKLPRYGVRLPNVFEVHPADNGATQFDKVFGIADANATSGQ